MSESVFNSKLQSESQETRKEDYFLMKWRQTMQINL